MADVAATAAAPAAAVAVAADAATASTTLDPPAAQPSLHAQNAPPSAPPTPAGEISAPPPDAPPSPGSPATLPVAARAAPTPPARAPSARPRLRPSSAIKREAMQAAAAPVQPAAPGTGAPEAAQPAAAANHSTHSTQPTAQPAAEPAAATQPHPPAAEAVGVAQPAVAASVPAAPAAAASPTAALVTALPAAHAIDPDTNLPDGDARKPAGEPAAAAAERAGGEVPAPAAAAPEGAPAAAAPSDGHPELVAVPLQSAAADPSVAAAQAAAGVAGPAGASALGAPPAAADLSASAASAAAEISGWEKVKAMSKQVAALQRAADPKTAVWDAVMEGAAAGVVAPVYAVLGAGGALGEMPPMPARAQQYPGGGADTPHEAFNTWTDGLASAVEGDRVRVKELAVWGDDCVLAIQVTCTVMKQDGTSAVVASPAPPAALVGSASPRKVVLWPTEYISCVNVWSSDRHGAVRQRESWGLGYASFGAIGSLSLTLSSCRVFRFGASWMPGCQHSVCAPSFDRTIPPGSHIVGLCGERCGDRISRLGVVYGAAAPASAAAEHGDVAPLRPYAAEHNAVSLSYLRRLFDCAVRPRDSAERERARASGGKPKLMTTDEVAKEVVMAASWDLVTGRALRFAGTMEAADLWGGPTSGKDAFFISHAFGNPFELLVTSLEAHFKAAGATFDSVFVWLDIFAINQADPGVDLDSGRTLTKTIDVATSTLVVLDQQHALPLTRLWCLYEIGFTPRGKLTILTHGFTGDDTVKAFAAINVSDAQCFDMSASAHIHRTIIEQHGSLERFTVVLKLRLLLRPLSYDGDIAALLARSAESFDFAPMRAWAAEPTDRSRIQCVTAPSGEGKSTLSAALTRLTAGGGGLVSTAPPAAAAPSGACALPGDCALPDQTGAMQGGRGGAEPWLHAWHFCKHSDARRQNGALVAKSLAHQLALRFAPFAEAILALDAKAVAGLQRTSAAMEMLVLKPLKALPAGTRPVILIDALDEAEPPSSTTALDNPLINVIVALHGAGCLVVTTTRPDPSHILNAVRRRWGDACVEKSPSDFLRPREPATADAALRPDWRELFEAISGRKLVLCSVAAALLKQQPEAAAPTSLSAAYAAIFEHGMPAKADGAQTDAVKRLLEVLMAAREPPSVAVLEQLGIRGTLPALPGWGVLFTERDFHVYSLHKSLTEWLKGAPSAEKDGERTQERFAVSVASGERVWAAHCCARALGKRELTAPVDLYSLRYLIQHLTAGACWAELASALLDFDFWEHVFKASTLEFAMLRDVEAARAAAKAAAEAAKADEAAARAHSVAADCLRWLFADGRFMRQEPRAVMQRALAAPSSSAVAAAARAFHRGSELTLINPPAHWPADVMTVDCGALRSVCYSPDGALMLAAVVNDAEIRQVATGKRMARLQGHAEKVTCCAWSRVGDLLATSSLDKTIKIWDAETGQLDNTLLGHSSTVSSCAFSPDGTVVLSGSHDKTLKLWDCSSGKEKRTLIGHSGEVTSCAFGPDGRSVVSGSYDKTLKLWDVSGGSEECIASLLPGVSADDIADAVNFGIKAPEVADADTAPAAEGPAGGENGPAALPNGDPAAEEEVIGEPLQIGPFTYKGHQLELLIEEGRKAVKKDGTLMWRDPCKVTLSGHSSCVRACAFSSDGQSVLSGSDDKTLKLWSAAAGGSETCTLVGHSQGVNCCAFSADGKSVLSGSDDARLKLWDAAAGSKICTLRGHSSGVRSCAFSPDGESLLSGSDDKTLKLWNSRSGGGWRSVLGGHSGVVTSCACSLDGATVLSGSDDGTLKLWALKDGEEMCTLSGHSGEVKCCAFSPDGTSVLSGSDDKTLKLWSASDGKERRTLSGHSDEVSCCAFSPDGQTLVSGCVDCTLKLWDATSGRETITLIGHSAFVSACCFSPDGRSVLSSSYDALIVWSAADGKPKVTVSASSDQINCCAFSPDGRSVLSGGYDRTLKIWDAGTGEARSELRGHLGAVQACRWVAAGLILSSSSEGTTRWWRRQGEQGVFENVATFYSKGLACALAATGTGCVAAVGTSQGAVEVVRLSLSAVGGPPGG